MKNTNVLAINLLMAWFLISLSSYAPAQHRTELTITGIRSAKGNIIVQLFKDNQSYEDQEPYKKIMVDKKEMAKGSLNVQLSLEPGIYGFTLVDDENNNGKIDKNMIGIPKEGFGFSNFFMEKMKKPTFDDFKIDLRTQSKIVMKVKYL